MSVENTGTNQFENVSGAAENSSATGSGAVENTTAAATGSGAVENGSAAAETGSGAVEGEGQLAQQLNQTAPSVNGNVAAENNATAAPAVENNTAPAAAPAAPVPTSGYVMSAKAKDLQERRKTLFKEMQAEYAKIFGDDKKAPKAKMYHAAGLLTIRERDGEDAYKAKLQEYIQANQGKYTTKTRKVNNTPAPAAAPESVTGSPIVASPASAAESGKTIIRSIESMASKVKEMVDTMVSTTKTLVKSDKPDMAAIAERVVRFANQSATTATTATTAKKPRKTRSNKGKTHKRRSPESNA